MNAEEREGVQSVVRRGDLRRRRRHSERMNTIGGADLTWVY